ncbi:hypothetical protein O3G_MSEX000508 [Manduca sexta]|nr:hypothetical protein O3G_MSEX000508 [Manduca sexta]
MPVLEYQQQQLKLLPHLATTYAMKLFSVWLGELHVTITINNMIGVEDPSAAARGMELHALSSGAKPLLGWAARDAIQNCREACGGHGYLKGNATLTVPQWSRTDHTLPQKKRLA